MATDREQNVTMVPGAPGHGGISEAVLEAQRDRITLDVIREILPDLDDGTLVRLIDTFVKDTAARLPAISRAVDDGDLRVIGFECHALASGAATFGAMGLSRLCRQGQAACAREDRDTAIALAVALLRVVPVVLATAAQVG